MKKLLDNLFFLFYKIKAIFKSYKKGINYCVIKKGYCKYLVISERTLNHFTKIARRKYNSFDFDKKICRYK